MSIPRGSAVKLHAVGKGQVLGPEKGQGDVSSLESRHTIQC